LNKDLWRPQNANKELGILVQQEEVRGESQDTAVFTPGTQQIGGLVDPTCEIDWCAPQNSAMRFENERQIFKNKWK
jgi:hypothetical protein